VRLTLSHCKIKPVTKQIHEPGRKLCIYDLSDGIWVSGFGCGMLQVRIGQVH
jgi:hypothetical protein